MDMAKDNKGEAFELEVMNILTEWIKLGKFGLTPETAKVKHNQGYYSERRKKEIITDVSIELTIPGRTNPYLLWVWECKDLDCCVLNYPTGL